MGDHGSFVPGSSIPDRNIPLNKRAKHVLFRTEYHLGLVEAETPYACICGHEGVLGGWVAHRGPTVNQARMKERG